MLLIAVNFCSSTNNAYYLKQDYLKKFARSAEPVMTEINYTQPGRQMLQAN